MDGLSKWLYDLSWPLVSRVLVALGLGTVTYTGVTAGVTGALDGAKNAFSGIGSEVLQIVAMSGFFDAMSITSGGIVSGLSFLVLKRFALQSSGT